LTSPGTLFFIFLLVYQFVFAQLLYWVRPFLPDIFVQSMAFIVVGHLLALLLPLAIWLAIKKERLSAHMPSMKLGRINGILVVAISFFLLPFMGLLSAIASMFVPNVAAGLLGQTAQHSVWVMLLAVAVTPAVVEEVVFRGYIQSQYHGWVFWRVAALNGLFFAVIHAPQQWLYAFAMGVVMAYMVHYTRSIRAGILAHFFMNAFNIVLFRGILWLYQQAAEYVGIYIYEAFESAAPEYEVSEWAAIAGVGVLCLVFLPFVIILWRAFISHNRQRMTAYDIKTALAEGSGEGDPEEKIDEE